MKLSLALGLAYFSTIRLSAADHGHLNAGALGVQPGDKLIFDNGADFAAEPIQRSTKRGSRHGALFRPRRSHLAIGSGRFAVARRQVDRDRRSRRGGRLFSREGRHTPSAGGAILPSPGRR